MAFSPKCDYHNTLHMKFCEEKSWIRTHILEPASQSITCIAGILQRHEKSTTVEKSSKIGLRVVLSSHRRREA